MRPFPSMWKCGVVHPLGLNPMSGDVKSLQGFRRSLEILTHMKKMTKTLGLLSGKFIYHIFFIPDYPCMLLVLGIANFQFVKHQDLN